MWVGSVFVPKKTSGEITSAVSCRSLPKTLKLKVKVKVKKFFGGKFRKFLKSFGINNKRKNVCVCVADVALMIILNIECTNSPLVVCFWLSTVKNRTRCCQLGLLLTFEKFFEFFGQIAKVMNNMCSISLLLMTRFVQDF